jgi:hypothetical protein
MLLSGAIKLDTAMPPTCYFLPVVILLMDLLKGEIRTREMRNEAHRRHTERYIKLRHGMHIIPNLNDALMSIILDNIMLSYN